MIKGPLNTCDYRFGDKVNSFINLVSFISIEYKTVKVKSAESVKKTLFFEFNGYKSAKGFGKALTKSYDQAIDEIEETLLFDFKKQDRLTYISNLSLKFSDVKSLLSNNSKSGYKHKNLKYSNVIRAYVNEEKVNDESFFQEYYTLIDQYLKIIILYLKNRQKLHNKLNDSEIRLHKINVPAEYESTKESPLKFFQYLITKKGVLRLLLLFKPSKDDFSRNDIDYDDVSNTITYNHYDIENGHFSNTVTFNDYFLNRLKVEFIISKRLIKEHFVTLNSDIEASFFLNRTLSDLKSMVKNVESDKDVIGYIDIKKNVNGLINHIKTKYEAFINPGETKPDKSYYFQLKGLREAAKKKAVNLHDSLVYHKFLEKISKKDFVKLFTGQQPSNKITWIGKKTQLKPFINLLINEDKIYNCKSKKWKITAANFKFSDSEFTNEYIKDTTPPKSQIIIKSIVSKISH